MPMIQVVPRAVFCALWLLTAVPVFAQDFTVDTFQDGVDASPGDGVCASVAGVCTFRAALEEAALAGSPQVIALPEGNYNWVLGELLIEEGDITVNGAGARATIVDAAGNSRFLETTSNLIALTLQGFEFQNGFDGNDPGGAIENDCNNLTLEQMVFRSCETGIGFGGAIHNRGEMEVLSCLFVDCVAEGNDGQNGGGGGGGALGAGGAVSSWLGSSSSFENCTFAGCIARGGDGGNGQGSGGGGQGGQSFTSFGAGGDGGNIGFGFGNNADAGQAGLGGGGGGGGFSTSISLGGPGDGTNGSMFGGDGGDGTLNGAAGGGGGAAFGGAFFSRSGTHSFRHCTFSVNEASPGEAGNSSGGTVAQDGMGRGGAIGISGGTITLDNCILFGNSAINSPMGDGEDIYLHNGGPILSDVGNNIVGVMENADETVFDAASTGNQVGVDPILLAFGDYGGPTDAFMLSACVPISPAMDAGAVIGVTEDQRGEPRDANPDIGAIEGPEPTNLDPVDGQVCPGETVELTLAWPDATTTWPDGSEGDTWDAPEISGVAVVTTAEGCVEEVAVEVTEIQIDTPDLGPDQTVCPGTPVVLDAGNPGAVFAWSTGALTQSATVLDSGLVDVQVNVQGCIASGEVMVSYFDAYPLELGSDVVLCTGETIELDAEVEGWAGLPPTFQWQAGPADALYEVSVPGQYTVTAELNGCTTTDVVGVSASNLTVVDLGADQVVCPGDPVVLDPAYPTAVCTWQDGSVSPTYDVSNTGIYSVNVALGDCQANAQVFVEVVTPFEAELPETASFCAGDSVLLLAAFGASNYQWQDGANGNQYWASIPGNYTVSSTQDGCTFTDEIVVLEQPLPALDLGANQELCEGEGLVLDGNVYGADYVIFNDSLSTPTLSVSESGVYTAEVAAQGCVARDTVEVEFRPVPVFELPEDTLLCPGDVLSIATGLEDVLVTWSTGEVGSSIEVNQPANYVATSQISGCAHVDSMEVAISSPIAIALEADYDLCLGDSLELSVLQGAEVYPCSYQWDDGNFQPIRIFNRSGVHAVEVANVCDTATHVLQVQQLVCGCQVYVPTAFTPNNDGKNDAWKPVLDCEPFSYKVVVWDRWGRPVFTSIDSEEVWYGQVEGTEGSKTRESGDYYAIDGTYMWEVVIELRKGRVPEIFRQNGFVKVLR